MPVNQLTFLIVIHSNFEGIDMFIKMLMGLNNKADILFSFDCEKEKIKEEYIQIIEKNGFDVFINGSNTGKLKLIINSVEKIKTPYFKIVDQDDEIYIKEIDDCNAELLRIKEPSLVKHRGAKVYEKNVKKNKFQMSDKIEDIEYHISKSKSLCLAQQTNFDTIFPTETVGKLKKINITRQEFHNDVFLSNFVLGMTNNFKKIKSLVYVQFHACGQTSKFNIKRAESIIELYDNYSNIKNEYQEFNFKRLM